MPHDKYSTWNRQTWYPQKEVPYKNCTACAVQKNAQSLFAKDDELSDF